MYGYIDWSEEGNAAAPPYMAEVNGLTLWVLPLGPDRRRRQQRRLKELARRGVRTAAAPTAFPLGEAAAGWGLRMVSPLPLRRAMLEKLLGRLLWEAGVSPGAGRVLLSAPWVTEDVRRAALYLAPRVRYLTLEAGRSGGELAAELERRWGLARSEKGPVAAEVAFGPRRCPEIPGLAWTSPAPCAQWSWQEGRRPPVPFAGEEAFLALLWEAGVLPAAQLCVKSVGNA